MQLLMKLYRTGNEHEKEIIRTIVKFGVDLTQKGNGVVSVADVVLVSTDAFGDAFLRENFDGCHNGRVSGVSIGDAPRDVAVQLMLQAYNRSEAEEIVGVLGGRFSDLVAFADSLRLTSRRAGNVATGSRRTAFDFAQ